MSLRGHRKADNDHYRCDYSNKLPVRASIGLRGQSDVITRGATTADEQGRLEEISESEEARIRHVLLANPCGISAVCECICERARRRAAALFPGASWCVVMEVARS